MFSTTSTIALLVLNANPDFHHFSLLDLNISYSHRPRAKVSLPLLILLAVVFPALTISLICLYPFTRCLPSSTQFRSLNTSLLGLGVSLAIATAILNVKNLAGRPRPDFLDRCKPDVKKVAAHTVGSGYGRELSGLWVLVVPDICQADWREVNEGFRSFPSGYATSMWFFANALLVTLIARK